MPQYTWNLNRQLNLADYEDMRLLVEFNQLRHPDRGLRYDYKSAGEVYRSDLDGWSTSDDLLELLDGDLAVPYFIYVQVRCSASEIPAQVAAIRECVASFDDAEIYEYISTALSQPRTLFKLIRVRQTYFAITTSPDLIYRSVLGTMLIENKTDMNLVTRITSALQKKINFEFTAEERTMLDSIRLKAQEEAFLADLDRSLKSTIFKPIDYKQRIEEINTHIESYTRSIRDYIEQLKDYELKQFAIEHGLDGNDAFAEAIEYIKQARLNGIHYIYHAEGRLYIAIQSDLRLGADVDNYLSAAKTSSNHNLYGRPKIIELLTQVKDGNIRLPMDGAFRITKHNNNDWRIDGINIDRQSRIGYKGLTNRHVTEYNCFQTGKNRMYTTLINGDYIAFFEQLFETVSSINVYDGAVMPKIASDLMQLSTNTRIQVRTPDGWVTMKLGEYYATLET